MWLLLLSCSIWCCFSIVSIFLRVFQSYFASFIRKWTMTTISTGRPGAQSIRGPTFYTHTTRAMSISLHWIQLLEILSKYNFRCIILNTWPHTWDRIRFLQPEAHPIPIKCFKNRHSSFADYSFSSFVLDPDLTRYDHLCSQFKA